MAFTWKVCNSLTVAGKACCEHTVIIEANSNEHINILISSTVVDHGDHEQLEDKDCSEQIKLKL